jgi:hypothetical protein
MRSGVAKTISVVVVLLGGAVAACSSNGGAASDANGSGTLDPQRRHPRDAGAGDAGQADSGGVDAGSGDSGVPETGVPDAGTDAGSSASVIQKVFYVMEENRDSSQVYGASDAPYINGTLMTTYEYATNYTNVVHPSEPNYVWLEAGFDMGLTTDNDPTASNSTSTTDHIVNYLGRVGKTWKSYQENLPGQCGITSSGQYAAKHNPFVFFQDVVGSYSAPSASCLAHVVDYSNLATDLASGTLADFIEVTPNLCDDGHDCANASVEAFLQSATMQAVITYVTAPAHHAILVLDWDESEKTNLHPMLLIAPTSTLSGTHAIAAQVDHSSFVRSMQRIYGVDPAHTDPTTGLPFAWLHNASTASDFSAFFAPGQFP